MLPSSDLEALRTRIDTLDAQIHELLRQRFAITAAVSAAKGAMVDPRLIPRPQREAAILEARLAAHDGPMPERSLIRIWREIMGAACSQQGDFRVGVAEEALSPLAFHAREHFGTAVPLVFDTLAALSDQIERAEIALILIGGKEAVPKGLHLIGTLAFSGQAWGQLLSSHRLEG